MLGLTLLLSDIDHRLISWLGNSALPFEYQKFIIDMRENDLKGPDTLAQFRNLWFSLYKHLEGRTLDLIKCKNIRPHQDGDIHVLATSNIFLYYVCLRHKNVFIS